MEFKNTAPVFAITEIIQQNRGVKTSSTDLKGTI
jgi:hypothetical protein